MELICVEPPKIVHHLVIIDIPLKFCDFNLKVLNELTPLIKCSVIISTVVIWKRVEMRVVSIKSLGRGIKANPKITYSDDCKY